MKLIGQKQDQGRNRLNCSMRMLIAQCWLEEPPTSHDLLLSSPASRSYWMCKNQLIVRDGLIFYAWLNDSQRRLCLLVPKAMQEEVLHCCHDMKSSAHLGQDKTLQRAKQHYMWYQMSQDCREYVQSCSVCNKNKKVVCQAQGSAPASSCRISNGACAPRYFRPIYTK